MNPFYDPGASRGARVHELFSRIAGRYDLINDLQSFGLHRYWKHRLIGLAAARAWENCFGFMLRHGGLGVGPGATGGHRCGGGLHRADA